MNAAEYRKARPGQRVRTKRALRNGWGEIPAGTVMTVTYKRSGFTLDADRCGHCGAQMTVRGVLPADVEIVNNSTEGGDA